MCCKVEVEIVIEKYDQIFVQVLAYAVVFKILSLPLLEDYQVFI